MVIIMVILLLGHKIMLIGFPTMVIIISNKLGSKVPILTNQPRYLLMVDMLST